MTPGTHITMRSIIVSSKNKTFSSSGTAPRAGDGDDGRVVKIVVARTKFQNWINRRCFSVTETEA